jgi:hypothetical protein
VKGSGLMSGILEAQTRWKRISSSPNKTKIRKIMSRQLENYGINILKLHAAWLVANGYKQQATSCKRQIRMILINKKKKEKQQAASFKLDNTCRI